MTTTPAGPMLRVDRVSFSYGPGRFELHDVSLEVARGELVGLLGPNGSGKSTLIKLVMRLLEGGSGRIVVDGRDALRQRRREYARQVAYLPQESRAAFAFTAMEAVLMGRSPHMGALGFETEDDRARARSALDCVDAGRFADTMLDELSGGERQRVMLARALVQESPLLVLDEPASFLDIRHQYELYELLRRLAHEQGKACLCVGHDVNVAAALCDRLVLLKEGRVEVAGGPREVVTAESIRRVYGIEAEVWTGSAGQPVVQPVVRPAGAMASPGSASSSDGERPI
ncbi:MAG TPA: ABC transporter ATP-binding protein [Phycisphaerae bacterium]|nr:ABC transporter ATP-binding protein [Phycisphaerae bacterium]HOI54216.1 ABC transporter ATP-binding protein [Phycisphaerae bacterium]